MSELCMSKTERREFICAVRSTVEFERELAGESGIFHWSNGPGVGLYPCNSTTLLVRIVAC
jgi:hypothetical protein